MRDDIPPELSGEWDDEPAGPSPMARRARMLRAVGIIALASLVLPGVLVTWSTSRATAHAACGIAAAYYAPTAPAWEATFEFVPLQNFGWNCYAYTADGLVLRVATLGIIPGAPTLQPLTGV